MIDKVKLLNEHCLFINRVLNAQHVRGMVCQQVLMVLLFDHSTLLALLNDVVQALHNQLSDLRISEVDHLDR